MRLDGAPHHGCNHTEVVAHQYSEEEWVTVLGFVTENTHQLFSRWVVLHFIECEHWIPWLTHQQITTRNELIFL